MAKEKKDLVDTSGNKPSLADDASKDELDINDVAIEDVLTKDRPRASGPKEDSADPVGDVPHGVGGMAEMVAIIEALIFVSEEPLSVRTLGEILRAENDLIEEALGELAEEFNARNGGLYLREVAGGWQFATRAEHHEHVRAFLKSRPSAKLSLPSLETLAVIAYKQPITVPEILEIRGVQSSSSIKTLLDKRLIVAKGRKETVGRPMLYGTSKEFLLQFGLKDLTELPNVEDFEDLAGGAE